MENKSEHIPVRMTPTQLEKLMQLAKTLGTNRNDVICKLIENGEVEAPKIRSKIKKEKVPA
jgi:hypothetical protein